MAYRAEIEIGVKGASRLKELQDRLTKLSRAVEDANVQTIVDDSAVQSVNEYSRALSKANRILNETAIKLDKNGNAIGNYRENIKAYVTVLGQANEAQKITNNLIEQEISARIKATAELKAYNAAAAAPTRRGAATTMAGAYLRGSFKGGSQYAGPIGPGAASTTALASPFPARSRFFGGTQYTGPIGPGAASTILGGQSSPVAENIARQLQARKELLKVREAIGKLDQESIRAHNARLDLQAEYLTVLNRTRDAAKFRAAQPAQQLALPAFTQRGLQLLDDSVKANQSQLRIEQALNGERARGVRFLQKQAEEERRQLELGIAGVSRTNLLPADALRQEQALAAAAAKQTERLAIEQRIQTTAASTVTQYNLKLGLLQQMAAIGRRIQQSTEQELKNQRRINRQIKVRRGRERQRRTREALGSGIIGGAFPLLFGQGVGASLGGAAGGAAGGLLGGQFGFGLSLVGTQIGSLFDQLTKNAVNLGITLNPLTADVDQIIQRAGAANTEFAKTIKSLDDTKQAGQALDLATQKLAQEIGVKGVQALEDLGSESTKLQSQLEILGTKVLAFVSGPLAAFIAEINKGLESPQAQRIQTLNQARSEFFAGTASPEVTALFEERRSLEGPQTERNKRRVEIDEKIVQLINEQNAGLDRQAAVIANNTDLQNLKRTFTEQESVINGLIIDDLQQQFVILSGNNSLLKDAVYEAVKNNIQNEYYRDLIKEQNGELEDGIALLRRRNSLADLENRRQREQDAANRKAASEAERAAREAKRIQDEADRAARATQALSIELQLSRFITDQNIEIAKARRDGNSELVYTLQINKELNVLAANIAKIENEKLSAQDEALKIAIAREQAAQKLNNLEQAKLDREKDIEDAVKKNLRSIQNEIDLSQARLNGTEDQVKLEQQLQAIKESTGVKDAQALEDLKTKLLLLQEQLASEKAIQEVRDIQQRTATAGAGLRAGFIGQAGQAFEQQLQQGATAERATEIALLTREMELAELQAQSLQNAVLGIGDAFAAAMTTGVSELIAGTKSAEEVFSDFLKNVGNTLLQAAQQMIATYIAIGIAKAFAGLGNSSAGSGDLAARSNKIFDGSSLYSQPPVPFKANGGPVQGGQPYMVGERGPELFVPSSNGGVMRNEDMRQLMGRSPVSNAPSMNFTFETTNIGGTEYVSREQLEAAMATTRRQAANDGAKRGMNMTLDRMQNSPRTRARVGIA